MQRVVVRLVRKCCCIFIGLISTSMNMMCVRAHVLAFLCVVDHLVLLLLYYHHL